MFSEADVALAANYTTIAGGVAATVGLLWRLGSLALGSLMAFLKKMGSPFLLNLKASLN